MAVYLLLNLTLITALLLPAAVSSRVKYSKLSDRISSLETAAETHARILKDMYLTADDRRVLGLPAIVNHEASVVSDVVLRFQLDKMDGRLSELESRANRQPAIEPKTATAATNPYNMRACEQHDWSTVFVDGPRFAHNQVFAIPKTSDGYFRRCLVCSQRQIRDNDSATVASDGRVTYDWYDD